MDALARGWDEAVDGPFPDVWTPASSSWTVLLRQRLAAADRPDMVPDELDRVAETPLVIAMPRPMALALGWPNTPIGWSDILALARDPAGWGSRGHPEWGTFRLGKTNPNFSTSGLNATIGAYFAATGSTSDLTVADVESPGVQDFVHAVESSVVHYGDTTLTFLSNLQAADDRGQGSPTSPRSPSKRSRCGTTTRATPPATPQRSATTLRPAPRWWPSTRRRARSCRTTRS
jgi:Ca-activated chloride channel family protein